MSLKYDSISPELNLGEDHRLRLHAPYFYVTDRWTIAQNRDKEFNVGWRRFDFESHVAPNSLAKSSEGTVTTLATLARCVNCFREIKY